MPKYRVKDQLHVSALGPETMAKGHEFEATKGVGGPLVKAGLVELVGDDEPDEAEAATETKAEEAAPENKALAAAPANKASTKGKAKAKA